MILRAVLFVVVALIITRVVFIVLRGRRLRPNYPTADTLVGIPGHDLKTLRNICRGDVEKMKRLIEHEKERRPGLDNREACRRVIDSYSRDNR
jgi:hypothetical protein